MIYRIHWFYTKTTHLVTFFTGEEKEMTGVEILAITGFRGLLR